MYRTLRLCAHGGGFEAIPASKLTVDLPRVRTVLESAGFPVLDARVMLIVSFGPEVTISRSGRLLFKTGDQGAAQAAFDRLVQLFSGKGLLPSGSDAPIG